MLLAAIASSTLTNYQGNAVQSNRQKWHQEFQQLGQDLQAGNLSAAQSDFTTLQQLSPQNAATSGADSSSLAQVFSQLGSDLQAGNATAAEQDYSNIQQQMPSRTARGHHHHAHPAAGSDLAQLMQQLGQALQAGNLSNAQQAYAGLQQQLQLLGEAATGQSNSSSVAVSA